MSEDKKEKYVTQSEFKTELKSLRLDFKELIVEIRKDIQNQTKAFQDQMKPIANLNWIIFRNVFSSIAIVGGLLIILIERDNDITRDRLSALEAVSFTSTNQIFLDKMEEIVSKNRESQNNETNQKKKAGKKNKRTGTRR